MRTLFSSVLELSFTGSLVILVTLLARLALCRAPRRYSYLLWLAPAFRLACPVSFTAAFSLFALWPRSAPVLPAVPAPAPLPGPAVPAPALPTAPIAPALPAGPSFDWFGLLALVWFSGMAALLAFGLFAELRLRRSLATATRLSGNVFQAEGIRSPFLLGLVRPRIYVPYSLGGPTLSAVLAHERYHLRRGDPLARRLAFVLLAVHWFNPLVWLAYALMNRDMELSCDEGVLRAGLIHPADYSDALLAFAAGRHFSLSAPLAFGETGVRTRIRNVLRWKKPRFWLTAAALLLTAAFIVSCAANPAAPSAPESEVPSDAADANLTLERDEAGNLIRKTELHPGGAQTVSEYGPGEILQRSTLIPPDGSRIVTDYDADGQAAAVSYFNTAGRLTSRTEDGHDAEGRKLSVTRLFDADGGLIARTEDLYNKEGALTTRREYDSDDVLTSSTEWVSEDDGKTVRTYTRDASGTLLSYSESRYGDDETGSLLHSVEFVADSHGYVTDFGPNQQPSRRQCYTPFGELYNDIRYTYTESGQLLTRKEYAADGTLTLTLTNTYDDRGNRICQEQTGPDSSTSKTTWTYEGDRLLRQESFSAPDCWWITEYDERGNEISHQLYDNGHPVEGNTTVYNEQNHPIRRESRDSRGNPYMVTVWTYNEKGQLTHTAETMYGQPFRDVTATYRPDGRKAVETTRCYADGLLSEVIEEEYGPQGQRLRYTATTCRGDRIDRVSDYCYDPDKSSLLLQLTETLYRDGVPYLEQLSRFNESTRIEFTETPLDADGRPLG